MAAGESIVQLFQPSNTVSSLARPKMEQRYKWRILQPKTDQTLGSTLCTFSRGSQLRIIIDRLPPRDKDKQTMNSSAQQCVERLWEDKWMESDNGWTWHPSVRFGEMWSVAMEQSLPIYWLWRFGHGTANCIACNCSELFIFRKQIPSAWGKLWLQSEQRQQFKSAE